MYLHLQRLYCTYICRACKVHVSSVQSRCTHSYFRTLSRHANGQRVGREHDDRFVLRASEPAHVLSLSFSLSRSLALSFSQEPKASWLPLRTRNSFLQPHDTAPASISISSSYRHAGTYGQPRTHISTNHWVIMKVTWACGCKGQHAARTQKQPKLSSARRGATRPRSPDFAVSLIVTQIWHSIVVIHTRTHSLSHTLARTRLHTYTHV